MTDKLTPAQCGCPSLGDMLTAYRQVLAKLDGRASARDLLSSLIRSLEEEAARREAEAKPFSPNKGCKTYDRCRRDGFCDDAAHCASLREGLDSADAELAHSLRSVVTVDHSWPPMALSIIRRYETDRRNAADRIEAQARKLSEVRSARDRNIERAEAFRTERDTLKARVAELEANVSLYQVGRLDLTEAISVLETRAEQAEAKAARLVIQMERAKIMIGARLDAMGPALREAEVNAAWHVLNAALAEAGHAK